MRAGAIVLAGGRSTRIGVDKAWLDRDGVPFVVHVATVAARCVGSGPLVVSAGAGQELPAFPVEVEVVRDEIAGQGPLQGLSQGLAAVAGRADVVLVLATDLPLLVPELGRVLLGLLDEHHDVVVPTVRGHRHPLAAVYRTDVGPTAARLLAEGVGRVGTLVEQSRTRYVAEEELLADPELAAADPHLSSLVNVNTTEDLERARASWARHDGVR